MAIDYLDFDLAIEAIESAPGRYRARVLHSPAGEASVEFTLPFSPIELENYILKMGRPRQGVRGLNSSEGRALHKTLAAKCTKREVRLATMVTMCVVLTATTSFPSTGATGWGFGSSPPAVEPLTSVFL